MRLSGGLYFSITIGPLFPTSANLPVVDKRFGIEHILVVVSQYALGECGAADQLMLWALSELTSSTIAKEEEGMI